MAGPCTVGLTGGLASGKTAVAAILAAGGVPVCDADAVVHRLYRPGEVGARAVARLFSDGVLDDDGGVDRAALAEVVLADPQALQRLDDAIHPQVRREVRSWLEGLTDPIAVVEAALLVETGAASGYDVLVVVACARRQQVERALARGLPEERVAAIMEAQGSLSAKAAVADVVIDNSGSLEELEAEVTRAWQQIVSLCDRRR